MPGLSFICNMKEGLQGQRERIDRSLETLIHASNYSCRYLLDDERFVLASTGYPEYPVKLLQLSDYTIIVEGRLYALADESLPNEMGRLCHILFTKSKNDFSWLTNWLLGTEGDFIILFLKRSSGEIRILNDVLGRLPCYFSKQGGIFMLSRELRFIANLVTERKYDRMAIAQCLLFGYPWGTRTFLKNIKRLPPATLVSIDEIGLENSLESLYTFNFDSKEHVDRTVQENASKLVKLFRESCRQRTDKTGSNVVSLSGGLDSRSVAAGLHAERAPFVAVTFLKHGRSSSPDMTYAAQLAKLCGWDWEAYLLDPPCGKDFLQLLRIKSGLNYLGMSFILPFLQRIAAEYDGNVTYFTGDGGDKLLPPLTARRFTRLEKLAKFVLHTNQRSSLKRVAALTQLPESEIMAELADHLATYPERDLRSQYTHFMIHERAMKWLFEGEDRNRSYFWTAAPFYSIRFFAYAMNCPDNQKERYLLYRRFLENLSMRTAEIVHADAGLPPGSRWYGLWQAARMLLMDWLPWNLKMKLQGSNSYGPSSPLVSCMRDQIRTCDALQLCFSSKALQEAVDNCSHYSREELENLFSMTSTIEDIDKRRSGLEDYRDHNFL
jgi:asparagine synthase (glutamine-hydrolysing)